MIKTFPIVMSDEFHKKVQDAAEQDNKAIKNFILEAIEEKIEKGDK